jgi:hypothetical protein
MKSCEHLFCAENKVDKNLDVLNGIKVLFMGWIMQGHLISRIMITAVLTNGVFVIFEKAKKNRDFVVMQVLP